MVDRMDSTTSGRRPSEKLGMHSTSGSGMWGSECEAVNDGAGQPAGGACAGGGDIRQAEELPGLSGRSKIVGQGPVGGEEDADPGAANAPEDEDGPRRPGRQRRQAPHTHQAGGEYVHAAPPTPI